MCYTHMLILFTLLSLKGDHMPRRIERFYDPFVGKSPSEMLEIVKSLSMGCDTAPKLPPVEIDEPPEDEEILKQ